MSKASPTFDLRECLQCKESFSPTGGRQLYCKDCGNSERKTWQKDYNKIYYREQRLRDPAVIEKARTSREKGYGNGYGKGERTGYKDAEVKIWGNGRGRLVGERWRDISRKLIDEIRNNPCTDCGDMFPVVCMEFDHVPERGPKSFTISTHFYWKAWDVVLAEIAKCDLVCSNCHKIRTRDRRASKVSP
jgi:hypothetical protein